MMLDLALPSIWCTHSIVFFFVFYNSIREVQQVLTLLDTPVENLFQWREKNTIKTQTSMTLRLLQEKFNWSPSRFMVQFQKYFDFNFLLGNFFQTLSTFLSFLTSIFQKLRQLWHKLFCTCLQKICRRRVIVSAFKFT